MELINRAAYSFSIRNRENKHNLFLEKIKPQKNETIIDVGATNQEYSQGDNYLEKTYSRSEKITAVALGGLSLFKKAYPWVRVYNGDGRQLSFKDNEFDIGYSNAVIEHVGDAKNQAQFLKELFRVSKRGFVTTPNRKFPIEVHTRIPLAHLLLPKKSFDYLLKLTGKTWAAGDYMNLLSERQLRVLLKNAGIINYKIYRQRFLGFTMTFSVVWEKPRN